MNDYEPLSLVDFCNAGLEIYDPARFTSGGTYLQPRPDQPPIGPQTFHGLPFLIGAPADEGRRCFLAFGAGDPFYREPVRIPVGKPAKTVIIAHAVLETDLWSGGPLGASAAEYVFHLADGMEITVPIRERFEIGHYPLPWGQYPFLCLPDLEEHLDPRFAGRWEKMGFRLTEVGWALPRGYFLWPWANPNPDNDLDWIEIRPSGQHFVLAAITLGHLSEEPFVRTPRRPVRITLLDAVRARKPFQLEVGINRGVATYAQPLPAGDLSKSDPAMSGFGVPANRCNSPAYTDATGIPSATIEILDGEESLGQFNWGELERNGTLQSAHARIELADPGRNWVRVRVLDASTGRPLPCRIGFYSPEGIPYPPHGHHAPIFSNLDNWNLDLGGDVRLGQLTYAYIDGTCEGWLPRGRVLVDAARGFEYEPLRTWVEIAPGQQDLTLQLHRWIDMNAQGYYSGDTHVHFLSSVGAQNEARGEDLNVVNLLQSQWGHLFTNTEDFTGAPQVSSDGRTIVYVSQENRQHFLGHLSLLGLKTPVMPWASGGPTEAELGGSLETTLSHWADAAHAQGGTVVLPHIPTPNGEPAALIATGRVDAVEMLDFLEFEHLEYYRYLNAGYRLPLVGGTDKMASGTPVGLYRTYVHLPPDVEFTYDNWCRALRRGHTYLSGGALLWLEVEGHPPGATIRAPSGSMLEIHAQARSIFPLHTLQIVQSGRVVAETRSTAGSRDLELREKIRVTGDSWLAARCAGPDYTARPHYDDRGRGIMAHSSPVYLTTGEEYNLFSADTAHYMLTLISGSLEYIRQRSMQYPPGRATHPHGRPDHLAELERPFLEAVQAIHQRMHQHGIPH